MTILKLRYFLTGYLLIRVSGTAPEKFFNLAALEGIPLWDIRHGAGEFSFKTDVDSFADLRHLARRTGCRLHILSKAGLPFLCNRLLRRRGLIFGLVFFILGLYLASSFILFIQITGNASLDSGYLRELAARAGAVPGRLRQSLDIDDVANRMLLAEPRLEWVGLQLVGTKLIIEVREAIEEPAEMDRPADLVAAKDGLVTEVLVFVGEAKVQPQETVRRGQLLIEGIIRPDPQYAAEGEGQKSKPVHAQGKVIARVWYEGYGEASLTETVRVRSGRSISRRTLCIEGQPVLRVGRDSIPFARYEKVVSTQPVLERIIRVPVEVVTETFYELELQKKEITAEQARKLALARARKLAELQLPADAELIDETVEELPVQKKGLFRARCILETREDIAVSKPKNGGESSFD
ncbi:MAG: sporulation protein YqfD [Bacillota bacterium]|nr:sporulation protein YqfD [Bacillota bacterium]